jgi:hypothetical protein
LNSHEWLLRAPAYSIGAWWKIPFRAVCESLAQIPAASPHGGIGSARVLRHSRIRQICINNDGEAKVLSKMQSFGFASTLA